MDGAEVGADGIKEGTNGFAIKTRTDSSEASGSKLVSVEKLEEEALALCSF